MTAGWPHILEKTERIKKRFLAYAASNLAIITIIPFHLPKKHSCEYFNFHTVMQPTGRLKILNHAEHLEKIKYPLLVTMT
jgi:hypothetical protein